MSCLTPKAPAEALPADVLAALDAASVIPRSSQDDNGTAYVIIRLPGAGSWTHGDETPERIAAAFPELSDGQLKRALRFISSRIVQMTRDIYGGTRSRRPNWCTNW